MTNDTIENCDYWDCPFCNWGHCTGDKCLPIEMNLCLKQDENEF